MSTCRSVEVPLAVSVFAGVAIIAAALLPPAREEQACAACMTSQHEVAVHTTPPTRSANYSPLLTHGRCASCRTSCARGRSRAPSAAACPGCRPLGRLPSARPLAHSSARPLAPSCLAHPSSARQCRVVLTCDLVRAQLSCTLVLKLAVRFDARIEHTGCTLTHAPVECYQHALWQQKTLTGFMPPMGPCMNGGPGIMWGGMPPGPMLFMAACRSCGRATVRLQRLRRVGTLQICSSGSDGSTEYRK